LAQSRTLPPPSLCARLTIVFIHRRRAHRKTTLELVVVVVVVEADVNVETGKEKICWIVDDPVVKCHAVTPRLPAQGTGS
jgi:hypothetical protein